MTTAALPETAQPGLHRGRHRVTVPPCDGTHATVNPAPDTAAPVNPALIALLDHLAVELAREYIRRLDDAVRLGVGVPIVTSRGEG